MKKVIRLLASVALCVSLAGCGVDVKNDNVDLSESVSEQEVEVTEELAEMPAEDTQDELVSPADEVVPDIQVAFEEEFTINKGQIAQIGDSDIFLEMREGNLLQFDGYTNTQVTYSFSVSGETYTGGCSFFSNRDTIPWIDQYNPYNIIVVAGTIDSITVIVQDAIYPDEPLELSGNSEDRFVTTKLEYIEKEKYVVYFDVGVTIEGDFIQSLDQLLSQIESETGLSFDSYLTGEKMLDDSKKYYYEDYRKFTGVDPEANKISIYVVNDDIVPNAFKGSVVLTAEDITFHDGGMMAIIHELIHCVHLVNGQNLGQTFTEGYATYISTTMNDKYQYDDYSYKINYSYYDNQITASNAQQLFLTESGWNSYLYGFRFMTYLMETYDKEAFNEILSEFSDERMTSEPTNEEVAEVIKAKTADTVFEDFGRWYVDHKAIFE